MTRLEIDNLSVAYGDRVILDRISVSFAGNAGVTCIIGFSGAGKSTLLKAGTRTLVFDRDPARAVRRGAATLSGDIRMNGAPAEAQPAHLFRRKVGHCLQTAVMLPGSLAFNLTDPLRVAMPHLSADARVAMAREAMMKVGLEDIPLSRPASAISGGQSQRVALARALVLQPDLLFLDEPTSALDPAAKRQVFDLAKQLAETVPVVIVTHDMDVARHADRVILLAVPEAAPGRGARLICDGSPRDVFGRDMPPELARMARLFEDV